MEPCQWILRAEGIAEIICETVAAKSYTHSIPILITTH